jgi:hypothetical protein
MQAEDGGADKGDVGTDEEFEGAVAHAAAEEAMQASDKASGSRLRIADDEVEAWAPELMVVGEGAAACCAGNDTAATVEAGSRLAGVTTPEPKPELAVDTGKCGTIRRAAPADAGRLPADEDEGTVV